MDVLSRQLHCHRFLVALIVLASSAVAFKKQTHSYQELSLPGSSPSLSSSLHSVQQSADEDISLLETKELMWHSSSQHQRNRVHLSLGKAHVVDGFVSAAEISTLRGILDGLGEWGQSANHSLFDEAHYNASSFWDSQPNNASAKACPVRETGGACPVPTSLLQADEKAIDLPSDVARRIRTYANENIMLDQSVNGTRTLSGNHSYRGKYYYDLSVLRRYHADDPQHAQVAMHADTDIDGRCLSAALYLNEPKDDEGVFRLYKCPSGREQECVGLQGNRLKQAYNAGRITDSNIMNVASETRSVPGRVTYFLSDNVHAVSQVSQDRDVLFVWLSCHDFPQGSQRSRI